MNHIPQELIEHLKDDKEIQSRIFEELKAMKENHLYHIERDMAIIQTDIVWMKNRKGNDEAQNVGIEWNTWVVRGFITAGISILTVIITSLIIKG